MKNLSGLGTYMGSVFLQLLSQVGPSHFAGLEATLNKWPVKARKTVEVLKSDWFNHTQNNWLNHFFKERGMPGIVINTHPTRNLNEHAILNGNPQEKIA